MTKRRKQSRKDFTAVGVIAASLMVAVTVFFGWKAANMVNSPAGKPIDKTSVTENGRAFLVYRSYRVLDRGVADWPNDDSVSYEFFRFPLDGSSAVGERIARETRDGSTLPAGVPWMSKVSDSVLLFARRSMGTDDVVWVDVSGDALKGIPESSDVIWSGLPSPDGSRIAYRDSASGNIIVTDAGGNRAEYPVPSSEGVRFRPFAWDATGENLYVETESGIEGADTGSTGGLWRLHMPSRSAIEVPAVRELGLKQLDLDPMTGRLAGVTFVCESLESCGGAPSSLYMVDTLSGESAEMMSSDSYVYGQPKFSPDGRRIAFTVTNGESDIWVADSDVSGHERRVISGSLLDWTPDGNTLVVDRDNELQLVTVGDGTVRSVVRRVGKYPDRDFHGVDYVGIIVKR